MSTTVSYKGNTIATLSNETKTLTTAGTWVEGDISITDAGGTAAISVVDTTDSHGGTIREITALDISDTTAVASDVANGKYFYTASGVKTAGTGSGGGSSGQSATGTFTGDGTITTQISCSFEPDLIRIYGDLSSDVTNRGIVSITIIKDDSIAVFSDTSTSATTESFVYGESSGISGYNSSTNPHATYANGVLTIDMVNNTSSNRFTSGIVYSYELRAFSGGGTPSATAHEIYFEFNDNTNTTITAYYDDSFISSAVTATTPTTYGNKTVTLAQLDGTTWYSPWNIPVNTELIDFTKVTENMAINAQGQAVEAQYYSISDYTPIDASMTFTAVGLRWYYIGFYDENYDVEEALYIDNISGTVLSNNNFKEFTLNSLNIPAEAKYCRITSGMNQQGTILSLIRTA